MTKIQKRRLIKLHDYMKQEQNKLGHNVFSFSVFHDIIGCNTVGCMAGELQYLFPKSWRNNKNPKYKFTQPKLNINTNGSIEQDLSHFFGLSNAEVRHLFFPLAQNRLIDSNCVKLDGLSSKEDVVGNLYRFLKIKEIIK